MITASHNPPQYNGIKFKGPYGGPFLTEETHKIESLLDKDEAKLSEVNVFLVDFTQGYIKQVERLVDFNAVRIAGINILIDSMAGAGQRIIEDLLRKNNCSSKTIFETAQSDFASRQPEPIEKNLKPLSKELKESGLYSFGIATDGDADRVGILMDNGEWLSAQETILYLADFLVNQKSISGGLVKTSSVSDKLIKVAKKAGRPLFNVQVGFKYICEKMITEDIAFGAEESGGYGYKGHMPERDGILSGLLVAEMLSVSGYRKLSDFVNHKRQEFGPIYYNRIDLEYHNSNRIDLLPILYAKKFDRIGGEKITGVQTFLSSREIINGLKYTFEGDARWLLIRASETEPLLRFYAEGSSDRDVSHLLELGTNITKIG